MQIDKWLNILAYIIAVVACIISIMLIAHYEIKSKHGYYFVQDDEVYYVGKVGKITVGGYIYVYED